MSTEATADKLLAYIDERCGGRVFALGGVSLGGQIVMELLARRPDVAEKAIIDGSLCIPQPFMALCCIALVRTCWGLMFGEKAARRQIKAMPKVLPAKMLYPDELVARYLEDMPRLPKQTMVSIYNTYMRRYRLKDGVRTTKAEVQYWYGEKEMECVKKSARLFQSYVGSAVLYEAKGYDHGYLSHLPAPKSGSPAPCPSSRRCLTPVYDRKRCRWRPFSIVCAPCLEFSRAFLQGAGPLSSDDATISAEEARTLPSTMRRLR